MPGFISTRSARVLLFSVVSVRVFVCVNMITHKPLKMSIFRASSFVGKRPHMTSLTVTDVINECWRKPLLDMHRVKRDKMTSVELVCVVSCLSVTRVNEQFTFSVQINSRRVVL